MTQRNPIPECLSHLRQMTGWRPIEEAPDNGDPVLCLDNQTGEIRVGIRKLFYDTSKRYEWFRDNEIVPGHTWSLIPTHYMELPKRPEP